MIMYKLRETSIEWSLKHLLHYYDSDFFPKLFEFKALSHNWISVKGYLSNLDLETYIPSSPIINLAHKNIYNFRVVHQLDPIDSIIFTSLVRESCEIIENYRIPITESIACSYRIQPDINGSFFNREDNGWGRYNNKLNELLDEYKNGYVLVCDIADYYNQIYTHRVQNILSEAGKGEFDTHSKILESFIMSLNKNTSKGIPVGPAPSIILAELVMGDIDKKILNFTRSFVRWVDDIRIFFNTKNEALELLHELSKYLYSPHRLIFSSEKTKIISTKDFYNEYFNVELKKEQKAVFDEVDTIAQEKIKEIIEEIQNEKGIYFDIDDVDIDYDKICEDVIEEDQFNLISKAYSKLMNMCISEEYIDVSTLRHIIRKSTAMRIRCLVPIILNNFEKLLPVIRESVIYLNRVLNSKMIKEFEENFKTIINSYYMHFPFINTWISYMLQNSLFNEINLPSNLNSIITIRDKALISLRKNDVTWIKEYKESIDMLGVWDKRAILYSSKALSYDEMSKWAYTVSQKGDIIDKSVASYIISLKKCSTTSHETE